MKKCCYVITALLALFVTTVAPVYAESKATVLITGANRGLGLEFVRQYSARDYRIIATARKPDEAAELQALQKADPDISIEQLDVTDLAGIDALAEKYKDQPIDILINNAGITGDPQETQVFGDIDYAVFDQIMHTNVLGPLKMTEAFISNVEASQMKKIVVVSSSMGSIGKTFGSAYFYRSSKSAVNMIMRSLVRYPRLGLKKRGIMIVLVDPGPTDTDMMAKTQLPNLRDPVEATADMIRITDGLTLETSGNYYTYDGTILPW